MGLNKMKFPVVGAWVLRRFKKNFMDYVEKKNKEYEKEFATEITEKQVLFFALKNMIENDSFRYSIEKEDTRMIETWIGSELPAEFVKVFEKYLECKKQIAKRCGYKLVVKKKWLIMSAIKQVIENDLFKK